MWLFGGDFNSANFYWLAKYNLLFAYHIMEKFTKLK